MAAYYEYKKGTRHGWDLNAVPKSASWGTLREKVSLKENQEEKRMERSVAIVLAAGQGSRMGGSVKKTVFKDRQLSGAVLFHAMFSKQRRYTGDYPGDRRGLYHLLPKRNCRFIWIYKGDK